MTQLILITGRAGSGKDTFARGLIDRGFKRQAYADALKEVTALIADEPSHLYHDVVAKEEHCDALGMTRRGALQDVGSAVRNTLGPNTWCNRVIRRWRAAGKPPTVITDCRYDNEADAAIAEGGIVIKIIRPDNASLPGSLAAHESERGVSEDRITIEVINDGSVGDLIHEAHKIANVIVGRATPHEPTGLKPLCGDPA